MKLNKVYIFQWIFVFTLLISGSAFAGQIRINEIYYDPPGSSSEEVGNEFIELYVTEGGFDPSGWYILDWDSDHKKWVIPDSCPQVETGTYILLHLGKGTDYVSGNSYHFYMGETSAKLSNTGDPIGLRNDKDVPQDFITYEGGTDDELITSDFCSWPNDGKNPTDNGLTIPSDSGFSLQLSGFDFNNSQNWIWAEPTPGAENIKIFFPILFINEIKFKGDSKWVEVYCSDDGNNGRGVDLSGYYFSDLDGETDKVLDTCFIHQGEYLLLHYNVSHPDDTCRVIENDFQFVNLYSTTSGSNETSDQMVLFDTFGRIKDAVAWSNGEPNNYEEKDCEYLYENNAWNSLDNSLCLNSNLIDSQSSFARESNIDTNSKDDWEKISIPTPGYNNERKDIFSKAPQITNVSFEPHPFILRESTLLKISFQIPYDANMVFHIYDVQGRMRRSLGEGEVYFAGKNTISWDGIDDDGREVKMGIYILYMEAKGSQGISSLKKTIVVGKRK